MLVIVSVGPLLAHGGGGPEAATIGLPLVIVLGFVWAERKARRKAAEERAAGAQDVTSPDREDQADRDETG